MNPPENINIVLSLLRNAGYRALLVGGCVRDSLMGKIPYDWDITTSATPQETAVQYMRQAVLLT